MGPFELTYYDLTLPTLLPPFFGHSFLSAVTLLFSCHCICAITSSVTVAAGRRTLLQPPTCNPATSSCGASLFSESCLFPTPLHPPQSSFPFPSSLLIQLPISLSPVRHCRSICARSQRQAVSIRSPHSSSLFKARLSNIVEYYPLKEPLYSLHSSTPSDKRPKNSRTQTTNQDDERERRFTCIVSPHSATYCGKRPAHHPSTRSRISSPHLCYLSALSLSPSHCRDTRSTRPFVLTSNPTLKMLNQTGWS